MLVMNAIYRPFLRFFRKRRMQRFHALCAVTPETRVLDVGGGLFNWRLVPAVPKVVILNLTRPASGGTDGFSWVVGDARTLPFRDSAFDVVFSNSVVEHLGSWQNQRLFAQEVMRVGGKYFVQTPSRSFPVEPHLLAPLIHWFPRSWQRRLIRNFTLWGLVTRPTKTEVEGFLAEVRLLTPRDLAHLFPEAAVVRERFLGLTKSLVAVCGEDRATQGW